MVHAVGLRVLVVLAVAHQISTSNSQVAYRNVEHRSYTENVKLSSYGHQTLPMTQPETTETRVVKHPDTKIVHHPSPIYVKRPPTFVTINHPDIVIEPNPVVYHKPAAVIRSPVIYRNLPQKVQYRHVVKNIVKPIEQKVVLEEKQPPQIFTEKVATNRNQHMQPNYFIAQQSDASNDAEEYVQSQQYNRRPASNLVYQPEHSDEPKREEMNGNPYNPPLEFSRIYYKQSFPSSSIQ